MISNGFEIRFQYLMQSTTSLNVGFPNWQSRCAMRETACLREPLENGPLGNEAVEGFRDRAAKAMMMAAAAKKIEELFDVLHIDHANDHNTRDTPRRVAKMFVEEVLRGRYDAPPAITEFENVDNYDGLIVSGPIEVRSMCAKFLMPIYGQ